MAFSLATYDIGFECRFMAYRCVMLNHMILAQWGLAPP